MFKVKDAYPAGCGTQAYLTLSICVDILTLLVQCASGILRD